MNTIKAVSRLAGGLSLFGNKGTGAHGAGKGNFLALVKSQEAKEKSEEAILKKKEEEENARRKKEAEEAAKKKKEAEEAAKKKKEAEEAVQKKEAEEAVNKKKEAEAAAQKKEEAEEATKKKVEEEDTLKKNEATSQHEEVNKEKDIPNTFDDSKLKSEETESKTSEATKGCLLYTSDAADE